MGREKYIRANNRKPRPIPMKSNGFESADRPPFTEFVPRSANPSDAPLDVFSNPNPNPNANPNPNFEETGWGYCTEDQLEELLLKNLEFLFQEAISKLVSLGYDEDLALKSILRSGHWWGSMDVLTNILHNAISYISSTCCSSSSSSCDSIGNHGNLDEPESGFSDLRQLEEYSLAGMVCLLQQLRPSLSRGDAMWCLLMSDLHLGRASAMEIPVLPPGATANGETVNCNIPGKFHANWGFKAPDYPPPGMLYDPETANSGPLLGSDIECPKRFNLSPSMKSLLKRNVAMFAAGFRANSKVAPQSHPRLPMVGSGSEVLSEQYEEGPKDSKNSDIMSSVLSSFGNMSIDEKSDGATDQKNEMILNLMNQIKDLEGQVKERREWAHQKALQAARKLTNDLMELKMLRMEREETLRLKKGKQTLEDTTMKRLSEMENALRKASGQVDRANAAVRRLETENAEIRAEMEASKLSAEESVAACLQVAKREKRCLKKLLAWEKQKTKLQEEVEEEKQKIVQLQQQLQLVKEAQKEAEAKWRQEIKAKELAIVQVEEERRAKEAAEVSVKRRQDDLRRSIETDFQRHKDDIERLEQELSRLKASAESTRANCPTSTPINGDTNMAKMLTEVNGKMLHDSYEQEDSSQKEVNCDRECLLCMKDEVSVVFLPCAHQVLCASCNEDHEKEANTSCPCCRIPIEQRIRVYGASS